MSISPSIREKLVKVLSLTDSEIEGESLAAMTAALRIVKANGLSWSELLAPPSASPHEAEDDEDADEQPSVSAAEAIEFCLLNGVETLTEWERTFLVSLRAFERLSDRQHEILSRIYAKCHQGG